MFSAITAFMRQRLCLRGYRLSILSGLLLIIGLFSLLQLMSVAIISNTMTQVKQDTATSELLRKQQALMDQARMNVMNASDKLNRAGIYLQVDKETGSVGSWHSLMDEAEASLKQAESDYRQLDRLPISATDDAIFTDLRTSYQRLYDGLRELADGVKTSNQIDIFFIVPIQAYQTDFAQKYVRYIEANAVKQKRHGQQFLLSLDRTHTIFMVVLGLLLSVSLVVWIGVNRIIIRPLKRIIAHLRWIAAGNLSHPVDEEKYCTQEIAMLNHDVIQMKRGLVALVRQVRRGVEQMQRQVDNVAADNQTLLAQATRQSNELKATTENILQLNEHLAQHTQHTEQASRHAGATNSVAVQGECMMNEVQAAMSEIAGRSREMSDVIGMIENVAFQTHILSLNAAIEAAHAGESGRGFSVVAREVGMLAAQSSQSAHNINQLIRDSDASVTTGANLVKKLNDSLQEIIHSAKGTSAFLGEIADIARQQARHINSVTQRIGTLNDSVRQNASQVATSAQTFTSLLTQAEQLNASVALFTLPEHEHPTTARLSEAPLPTAVNENRRPCFTRPSEQSLR